MPDYREVKRTDAQLLYIAGTLAHLDEIDRVVDEMYPGEPSAPWHL